MGSGQLAALVACLWMLFCEVASQNHIKIPKEQKTGHLLLINEVNADNPGEDTLEYVELYHASGQQTHLDGYHLVFYNGNGNQAYKILDLKGFSTDNQGFFLLGSSAVVPKPLMIFPKNTIQNGPDAIALYWGSSNYYVGMNVTSQGLVDALVHKSKKSDRADELVRILTPDTDPFLEDPLFRTTDESLERCQGMDARWFFQTGAPTPGSDNHCIPFSQLNSSVVLINEVSAVSSPGEFEFVELQGPPSTELKGLVLVLMEGSTQKIYFSMDVFGTTSPDGLLLIGSSQAKIPVALQFPPNSTSPLLKAGVNAVALYRGANSSFPAGASASVENLLDALVYTTVEGTDSELRDVLTPGRPVFYVRERSHQGNESVNRCACCSVTRDPSLYALGRPTPGQFNDCPRKRFSREVVVCLQVADCQQESPEVHLQTSLAQALDKHCNCGVSPAYFKEATVACNGTELAFAALLTARSAEQLDSLLQALSAFLESEATIRVGRGNGTVARACSRDANGTTLHPGTRGPMPEKPGAREPPTPQLELLINEVNPDNPGGQEDTEYIELFYPGQAPFDLRGYWLVLYNGKNNLAYKVLNLTGYSTNAQGYFLVGSVGVVPKPLIVLPNNTIQNGVDAVALYHSSQLTYRFNMLVTGQGLVDAVVYKSRGADKADKLIAALVPGQAVLHEDDSYSSQDESLSRCHSLTPRNHNSFQVTVITPFRENICSPLGSNSTEEAPHNASVVINELGLANDTLLYQFIELKGMPGASLGGHTLAFFSGQDDTICASIPLKGTFGSSGLFVIVPEGQAKPEQPAMSCRSKPSAEQEPRAVALFNLPRLPSSGLDIKTHLEDAVVYVQESSTSRGHLGYLGLVHSIPRKGGRPVSLSRCSSCRATYAVSDPTPGLENRCPEEKYSVDLRMCLLTTSCSVWPQNPLVVAGLQRALAKSMEESCLCGVCPCYLQGLNFTCLNATLKLSGQAWARSPEQLQLLTKWQTDFTASSQPFPVDGKLLKTNAGCPPPAVPAPRTKASSFRTWETALIILGSILVLLMLAGVVFYCFKRRPLNYANIEMNDRCEIMADI